MKEKNKNIDRLFQEKFKDFEAIPKEEVWKNIKKELQEEKRRGIVLPLWLKLGGVAAALLALFLLGNFYLNPQIEQDITTQDEEKPYQESQEIEPITKPSTEITVEEESSTPSSSSQDELEEISLPSIRNQADREQSGLVGVETPINTSSLDKPNSNATEQNDKTSSSRKAITNLGDHESEGVGKERDNEYGEVVGGAEPQEIKIKVDHSDNRFLTDQSELQKDEEVVAVAEADSTTAETEGKSLLEEIADQQKENTEPDPIKSRKNRISIRPNIAPIYYNSLGSGNSVDPALATNKTSGEVTMSYGIDVSYAVSKRLKVRTGVSKVNMSYNTNDIAYTSSVKGNSLENVQPGARNKNIQILGVEAEHSPPEITNAARSTYASGKLNQQLEYFEMPVEIEYALVDERFGVNLIGGASTLFLQDDSVRINSDMGTTELGRANNLNSVSFTTNIGVGLGYDFTKQLNFSIEPTFKYQVNGFSGNTSGFKPYYFGVYSGVSFTF